VASKIDEVIDRLEKYRTFELGSFTLILDDPAGNSFIENPYPPNLSITL
jgi:zinc finger protein